MSVLQFTFGVIVTGCATAILINLINAWKEKS